MSSAFRAIAPAVGADNHNKPEAVNRDSIRIAITDDDPVSIDEQATAVFDKVVDNTMSFFGTSVDLREGRHRLLTSIGPSSNHALFRNLSKCFARKFRSQDSLISGHVTSPSSSPHLSHGDPIRQQESCRSSELNDMMELPSISEMNIMIERFFDSLAPIWPFVRRSEIMLYVQHLKENLSLPRLPTALLLTIWALAIGYESKERSRVYYERATRLLASDLMRKPSRVLSK